LNVDESSANVLTVIGLLLAATAWVIIRNSTLAPALMHIAVPAAASPRSGGSCPCPADTPAGRSGRIAPVDAGLLAAPSSPGEARRRRILTALAPAAVHLAVRAVGVGVLAIMAGGGPGLLRELTAWDGSWLLAIARYGYAGVPTDMLDAYGRHTDLTAYGFFPGYPGVVAVAGLLVGPTAAALIVSLVAGVVGAYGLTRLGELVPGGSRRAGLLLAALFAAAPMSVVLSMAYTEALFCALAAWSLVGVLRRQWLLAGLCSAGAGLVRPTATALVAAVGLAALAAAISRQDGWRPWLGGLLAPVGLLAYLGWVAVRTGAPDGWYRIQREGWGWYVDGGGATARYVAQVLAGGNQIYDVAVVAAFVAGAVLVVIGVAMRLPWPLLVYGTLALLTVWSTEGLMNAKLRLLLPAFVLLLPIALGLAKRRPSTAIGVVVAAALASAWFGGYALTIWPYGI
jgi:hypothetical protein